MTQTAVAPFSTTSVADIKRIFHSQQENNVKVGRSNAGERIAKLRRLKAAIERYRPEIKAAMYADFKKPAFEVDAVEVYPITGAIKHTCQLLGRWMQPQRVPTPLAFLGSSSWVQYESKGVTLIISPWNFPFNLTFVPLISAIAAGNCVVVKPSEMTPHSAAMMKKIVSEVFDENEVALVEGGVEVSQALLAMPFHHIFFTGAPSIGKVVMKAAAEHLTSCTLELGGKSPTVIDESADLPLLAKRLAWSKFVNCGQICTAPDYVLVQESRHDELLDLLRRYTEQFFGKDPAGSASYARMVNARHFERVKGYLEDAVSRGARVVLGGRHDASQNYISPTVLSHVPEDALVMQEEIFGPLLPVRPYRDLQDAIQYINAGERPLTMNIFSKNKRNIRQILQDTRSGGVTINHSTQHFYNHDLPFGGVNNSGIGKAHGWHGFADFSNARAIYRQHLPSVMDFLLPPYNSLKEKVIALTIRWL